MNIAEAIYNVLVNYGQANEMSYLGQALITPDRRTEIAKQGYTVRVSNMESAEHQSSRNGSKLVDVRQYIEIYVVPAGQNEIARPAAEREVDLIALELSGLLLLNSELDNACISVVGFEQRNGYRKPGSTKMPVALITLRINPKGQSRG